MKSAHLGVVSLMATSALLAACTSDGAAPSVMGAASAASATAPMTQAATVDNFMLVDQNLEAHELYRLADAKAVVLVTQANGDAVMRGLAPALKALKAGYAAKGVEFLMLNSSLKDDRDAVIAEAKSAGYDTPVLLDVNQLVGEQLGVSRSAEVLVVNPKTWTVVYRGALDAQSTAAALDAVIAGKAVQTASAMSKGAAIAFPERGLTPTRISYAKDVAPILEAKCVACHQEGGIGPFAMTNYQMVKGFSPMIREVLRTDRMPPYNADPHVGKFADSKNLSSNEIKTLVHWIEAGSPRGSGVDPLGAVKHVAPEWPLGKPDLILNVPAYKIPASGVVDYQHPYVVNPLTEGKWIRASTIKVGERQGVHHILTGYMTEIPKDGQAYENKWGVSVGGYAVGAESEVAPKNVGTYMPAGGAIGMQNHYTPFGKEVTDHSQIALYFYDKKPEMVMHNSVIVDNTISLPPGDGNHEEVSYLEFPKDALLYSAFPHAHYRGKAADVWIRYPDGKEKLLLSLPRYDFSWQRDYTFAEPIKVPAGSKLIAHFWYDNSKRNPNNPDPTKTVVWGDQSWEEMFYVAIRYRWEGETSDKMNNFDQALNEQRMFTMMDDNIDGKLQKSELKGRLGGMIGGYFAAIDTNKDGVLQKAELNAAQSMLGGGRRRAPTTAAQGTQDVTAGGK